MEAPQGLEQAAACRLDKSTYNGVQWLNNSAAERHTQAQDSSSGHAFTVGAVGAGTTDAH